MFEKAKKNFYEKKFGEYGEYGKDFIVRQWGSGGGYMIESAPNAPKQAPPLPYSFVCGDELFITDRIKDVAGDVISDCVDYCGDVAYNILDAVKSCLPYALIISGISVIPLLVNFNTKDLIITQNAQTESYVIMQNEEGENVLHLSTGEEVISMEGGYLKVQADCGELHTTSNVMYYSDGEVPQKEEYDEVCECVEDETFKKHLEDKNATQENTETEANDVVEMNQ